MGSGRRGGSRSWHPAPREEGLVRQAAPSRLDLLGNGAARAYGVERVGRLDDERVGPVGEQHHGDLLTGLRALEHVGQRDPAVRRSGVPDGVAEAGRERLGANTECPGRRAHRAGMHTADDHVVEIVGRDPRVLACVGERRLRERQVGVLAEALLPHVRRRLTRQPPAVEELERRRPAAEQSRLGAVVAVGWTEHVRRRAVTAVRLVGATGQAGAHVGADDERRLGGDAPSRIAAIPDRTEPTTSYAATDGSRPSAAWIAVAFVLSRYAGSAVANSRSCGVCSAGRFASALRAASTPIVVVSSSYEATARVPGTGGVPSASAIAARSSRRVGR